MNAPMKFAARTVSMTKAELRAHLDAKNPDFGAMIDGLRAEFPGIKLVHLKTDAVEIGTPTDPSRLVEMSDSTPAADIRAAWNQQAELAADMHKRQRGFKVKPKARKK